MTLSVLRRYTPPTCTLEILGTQSPLSRWMGQPVVKQLRFRLSLDDPKLPQEDQVTLEGDRSQLEMLSEVVTTYIQQFLQQTPTSLGAAAAEGEGAISTLVKPAPTDIPPLATADPVGMALQPRGLLSHELALGSLATAETGTKTRLSATQLFDLANALDDYSTDLVALPGLPTPQTSRRSTPGWAQVAAACLLVVGLSATLVRLTNPSPSAVQTTAANNPSPSSSDQQIATQLPPAATTPASPPTTSSQKLPPPPPIGSTTPLPSALPRVTVPPMIAANPADRTAPTGTPTPTQRGGTPVAKLPESIASREAQGAAPSTFAAPPPPAAVPTRPDSTLARRSTNAAGESAPSAAVAPPSQNSTAFDTIPQVAEVRQYFQQRWAPPAGLTQTLEYTLTLAPDGSIRQITPLGRAAGDYVDRSGIPLVGEAFVSPLSNGRSARIRLVLSPDGKVQTFLEQGS